MKKLKCCGCKERFPADTMVRHPIGNFCTDDCAKDYGKAKSEKLRAKAKKIAVKQDKQAHTKAKRKLKDEDRSFQLKKTQQVFNKFIRLRDDASPCISCGRFHEGQYHAGHYRSVGGNSSILRFNPNNCHKQCSSCNNHLSGNLVNYRISLIAKFGVEYVQELEGHHEPKRYTIDDLKEIQSKYKLLIKELESNV